ncbi:MAG: hypothetical protein MZW92_67620 [Comamonadaceae bacterium]|nr:hypothetical protein [Comamonadaceae bacterium]
MLVAGADGRILFHNAAVRDLFGIADEVPLQFPEATGRHWLEQAGWCGPRSIQASRIRSPRARTAFCAPTRRSMPAERALSRVRRAPLRRDAAGTRSGSSSCAMSRCAASSKPRSRRPMPAASSPPTPRCSTSSSAPGRWPGPTPRFCCRASRGSARAASRA